MTPPKFTIDDETWFDCYHPDLFDDEDMHVLNGTNPTIQQLEVRYRQAVRAAARAESSLVRRLEVAVRQRVLLVPRTAGWAALALAALTMLLALTG